MNKIKNIVLLMLFFSLLYSCEIVKGQNLALAKSYTLSSKPNYKLSAPANDTISLTDGKNTMGRFWVQKTTVGWFLKSRIKITVDLKNLEPLESINLTTAAGKAGVKFPKNVYAFISADGINFEYVGDAVKKENNAENYESRKLSINNIHKKARFVSLIIIPNGNYFFTDEIEVLKSTSTQTTSIKVQQKLLIPRTDDVINYLKSGYIDQNSPIYSNLQDFSAQGNSLNKDKAPSENIAFRKVTYTFKEPFVVNKSSPWSTLSEYYNPEKSETQLNFDFPLIKGQHQYDTFVITNTQQKPERLVIERGSLNPDKELSVQFFEVPFVYTASGEKIPDPLIPLKKEGFTLAMNETKMILFKCIGTQQGTANEQFMIMGKDKNVKLNIKANIISADFPDDIDLNANVWTYLNYPLLRDNTKAVSQDIQSHGINTLVLNWSVLTGLGKTDFSKMIAYLKGFNGVKNILLFYNFKNEAAKKIGKSDFLSDSWKEEFRKWYATLENTIHTDYNRDVQLYFYPYDEIRDPSQIKDFKELIEWSHQEKTTIKYFATLSDNKAIEVLLPLVDIAQIVNQENLITVLPKTNTEIWSYEVQNYMRSLPSYSFYRLMAWRAFANDYKGIGFWNYADTRKKESVLLNEALVQSPNENYSVVYFDAKGQLYSSRRWEAFSKGLEDYKVIKHYADKYGKENTEKLVKEVLENTNNVELADEVIHKMIQEL